MPRVPVLEKASCPAKNRKCNFPFKTAMTRGSHVTMSQAQSHKPRGTRVSPRRHQEKFMILIKYSMPKAESAQIALCPKCYVPTLQECNVNAKCQIHFTQANQHMKSSKSILVLYNKVHSTNCTCLLHYQALFHSNMIYG